MIVAFAAGNNYTYIDSMTAFVEGECSNIEYYSVFFLIADSALNNGRAHHWSSAQCTHMIFLQPCRAAQIV